MHYQIETEKDYDRPKVCDDEVRFISELFRPITDGLVVKIKQQIQEIFEVKVVFEYIELDDLEYLWVKDRNSGRQRDVDEQKVTHDWQRPDLTQNLV